MTAQPDRATYGLRPDILSQWETLAQSLSSIAPTAAPAMIIPLVIAAAGRSAWVSFVVATIAMALVAAHVNVFARDSATPGSLYAFVRGEFGSWVALPAGWALLVAYIGTAAAVTGGIIQYAQNLVGIAGTGVAILLIVLSIGLSAMLAYRNVELSTRFMLWIECASVATIVLLFVIPTRAHPLSWDPTQFAPSVFAVTPVGAGLVLATFAFVGFESATALGAEAKDPLRTIPRAVMGTALISGAFFVFSTYAEVDAVGSKVELLTGTQAPLQVLATLKGRSWVGPIVSVGAIMSFFACAMSCITAAARTMFLMGAQKVLPSRLGQVHAQHQTPSTAVIVSSIAAVVPAVALAARHVSAFDLYGWLATIATYGFLAAYVFVTIAAPIYELRRRTLTVPKAGLAIVTVAFLVWAFVASLPPATSAGPERWLAPIFCALIVAGCAYCVSRRRLVVAGAMTLLFATPARAQSPTPYRMTTSLEAGNGSTSLDLPIVAPVSNLRVPVFAAPEPHEQAPDARTLQETGYPGAIVTHNVVAKTTAVDFLTRFSYQILEYYETHDDASAQSRFVGHESHHICRAKRCMLLRKGINVQSDSTTLVSA